jgi:serine/threonine protein kinase
MAWKAAHKSLRAIGGYEVVQRLAVTGLTAVYKARHPVTGDLVAVKVAGPEVTRNPVLLKRFEQEFTVTRGLDHPHWVRALQFGNEGEVPYIVLEFVDGPSLGDRIEREGRLPEAEAVRAITQVAQALHHAHQRRVVHRDVKPDNILLAADGRAKLTDLGLAKDVDAGSALTRPSSGLGTPNFMAPEQFRDVRNADPRSDVYSLGATLYMAITGELPFRARGPLNVWMKKRNNELIPPRKLVPVLTPWIESAIARAVQADPQARPASCLEFIEELNGDFRPAPARAVQPSSAGAEPAPSPQPRRREQPPPARAVQPSSSGAEPAPSPRPRGSERRATVRYPSGKDSSCRSLFGEKGVHWAAKVQDVSVGGLALFVSRRFEPATVLAVELAATNEEPGRRLLVRVVRVQALSPRRWLIGCVLANPMSDDEVQAVL